MGKKVNFEDIAEAFGKYDANEDVTFHMEPSGRGFIFTPVLEVEDGVGTRRVGPTLSTTEVGYLRRNFLSLGLDDEGYVSVMDFRPGHGPETIIAHAQAKLDLAA